MGGAMQAVLDSGARDDLLPPQPNARLARSFRPQDVTNLLAILGNAALAPELRRSGAEQLLALTVDDRLRALMLEQVGVRAEMTYTCIDSSCMLCCMHCR